MFRLFHARRADDAPELAQLPSSQRPKREPSREEAASYQPLAPPDLSYDEFTARYQMSAAAAAESPPRGKGTDARVAMASRNAAVLHRSTGLLPGWRDQQPKAMTTPGSRSANSSHASVPAAMRLTRDRGQRGRSESPSRTVVTSAERVAAAARPNQQQQRRASSSDAAASHLPSANATMDSIAAGPSAAPQQARKKQGPALVTAAALRRAAEASREASRATDRSGSNRPADEDEDDGERSPSRSPQRTPEATRGRRRSISPAHDSVEAVAANRRTVSRGRPGEFAHDPLTALVQGLRARAKYRSPFARGLLLQMREAARYVDELRRGDDLPFTLSGLQAQIGVCRTQLRNYLVAAAQPPINWAQLRAEFNARHNLQATSHHQSDSPARGPAAARSSRSATPEAEQPSAEEEHAHDRRAEEHEADHQFAAMHTPSQSGPRKFKMLKRGAGLRRFYGDHAAETAAEVAQHAHEAAVPSWDDDGPSGAARIAALAAPRHVVTPPPAATARRSASAQAATTAGGGGDRAGSTRGRRLARHDDDHHNDDGDAEDDGQHHQQRGAPLRRSNTADKRAPKRSASAGGRSPTQQPHAAAIPRRSHGHAPQTSTAMAVPLTPELSALLAPSSTAACEPWSLASCLRRPALHTGVPGLLPSAAAARELLTPFVASGRDFNALIDNLTGLL